MLFYIMAPYSGSRIEMFHRHFVTSHYVSKLVQEGLPCISPVMHWHFSAHIHHLPHEAHFWNDINIHLFNACDAGILLKQPGWQESKGVSEELKWHEGYEKPVYFLDIESDTVDGYTDRCIGALLERVREDFPLLREVPVYEASP